MTGPIFILYVGDQERSKKFYQEILGCNPVLDVPGMTEFPLGCEALLGIMPEEGIARILGDSVPHPVQGQGIPRCELYFRVERPEESFQRLIKAGGKGISAATARPWGDVVAYGADPDGHIIAFASSATGHKEK